MAEIEEELIGEDLDYEYDLDEEEEEALLAEEQETVEEVIGHDNAENIGNENEEYIEEYQERIEQDHGGEPVVEVVEQAVEVEEEEEEEEEEDLSEGGRSRDRFKSERTKISLTQMKKERNIPESLDEVSIKSPTTKIFNQRGGNRNNRGRMNNNRRGNFNNRRGMQNRPMMGNNMQMPLLGNYPNNFNNFVGQQPMYNMGINNQRPLLRMPLMMSQQRMPQPRPLMGNFSQIPTNVQWSHGMKVPLNSGPADEFTRDSFEGNFEIQKPLIQQPNYMLQSPTKRPPQKNENTPERKKQKGPVHSRLSRPEPPPSNNPNLKTIETVDINKDNSKKGGKLNMDDEYAKSVEAMKKKREEYLRIKELRRKQTIAQAKSEQVQTSSPSKNTPMSGASSQHTEIVQLRGTLNPQLRAKLLQQTCLGRGIRPSINQKIVGRPTNIPQNIRNPSPAPQRPINLQYRQPFPNNSLQRLPPQMIPGPRFNERSQLMPQQQQHPRPEFQAFRPRFPDSPNRPAFNDAPIRPNRPPFNDGPIRPNRPTFNDGPIRPNFHDPRLQFHNQPRMEPHPRPQLMQQSPQHQEPHFQPLRLRQPGPPHHERPPLSNPAVPPPHQRPPLRHPLPPLNQPPPNYAEPQNQYTPEPSRIYRPPMSRPSVPINNRFQSPPPPQQPQYEKYETYTDTSVPPPNIMEHGSASYSAYNEPEQDWQNEEYNNEYGEEPMAYSQEYNNYEEGGAGAYSEYYPEDGQYIENKPLAPTPDLRQRIAKRPQLQKISVLSSNSSMQTQKFGVPATMPPVRLSQPMKKPKKQKSIQRFKKLVKKRNGEILSIVRIPIDEAGNQIGPEQIEYENKEMLTNITQLRPISNRVPVVRKLKQIVHSSNVKTGQQQIQIPQPQTREFTPINRSPNQRIIRMQQTGTTKLKRMSLSSQEFSDSDTQVESQFLPATRRVINKRVSRADLIPVVQGLNYTMANRQN